MSPRDEWFGVISRFQLFKPPFYSLQQRKLRIGSKIMHPIPQQVMIQRTRVGRLLLLVTLYSVTNNNHYIIIP